MGDSFSGYRHREPRNRWMTGSAKQSGGCSTKRSWIASSRSLSSGAHSRNPLVPRNDEKRVFTARSSVTARRVGVADRFHLGTRPMSRQCEQREAKDDAEFLRRHREHEISVAIRQAALGDAFARSKPEPAAVGKCFHRGIDLKGISRPGVHEALDAACNVREQKISTE